jgi:DNA-directed RNA polymerase specialized sigma24 family protein
VAESPAAPAPEVWDAVASLPSRQRTAVALRYILDLPEAEVAKVMKVSRGSASASLTAARRRLEGLLADDAPVAMPHRARPTAPGLLLATGHSAVPRG